MRLSNVAPVQWVTWQAQRGWRAMFPPTGGRWLGGEMAMSPGPPPPVQGKYGGSIGPHPMEFNQ